jgi:hypothetical protein
MDCSIEAAVLAVGGAIISKVVYDLWSRWREKRGIAAAIAGELGAYIAFLKMGKPSAHFRTMATMDSAMRVRVLRAFPPLPTSHPVFDKVADKIGLLPPDDARAISRAYNAVTGFRLHLTNLSSDRFLAADDAVQAETLKVLATMLEDEVKRAKSLIDRLLRIATTGF